MSLDPVPGYVCAFHFGEDGTGLSLAEAEVATALAHAPGWIWLHLNLADWRCRRWLSENLSLPQDVATCFAEPSQRQHLSFRHATLFGHLADFRRAFDGDSTEFAWLHFMLGKRFLVTGRVKAVLSAEHLRAAAGHGDAFAGPEDLFGRLLANYPDTLEAALHRLTGELELIEDHVLDDRHRGERKRLMLIRRETAQLHRHMRALRRALQNAGRDGLALPPGIAAAMARLTNLDQDFDDMERRARFFHDEIDAKLAAETNRQLYILSALTAAFLPPALVAGLFGMNVPGIPWTDSPLGFWAALGLSVLSSGAVVLYLRFASRN